MIFFGKLKELLKLGGGNFMYKKIGSCIEWKNCKDKDGYGRVKIDGKSKRVHRVVLEVKIKRKLSKDEHVLHICNNRICYNVDHLRLGTSKDNAKDRLNSNKYLADQKINGWRNVYGLYSGRPRHLSRCWISSGGRMIFFGKLKDL